MFTVNEVQNVCAPCAQHCVIVSMIVENNISSLAVDTSVSQQGELCSLQLRQMWNSSTRMSTTHTGRAGITNKKDLCLHFIHLWKHLKGVEHSLTHQYIITSTILDNESTSMAKI